MDIDKNIANATYFINKMQAHLPNIKNRAQRDFTIDMLNSFIVLINTIETLQKTNPLLKVIYSLLTERMYRDLFKYASQDAAIPVEKVFRELKEDIQNPFNAQLEKLVGFLKLEEITYLVNTDQSEKLPEVSADKWRDLVLGTLGDLKNNINWN